MSYDVTQRVRRRRFSRMRNKQRSVLLKFMRFLSPAAPLLSDSRPGNCKFEIYFESSRNFPAFSLEKNWRKTHFHESLAGRRKKIAKIWFMYFERIWHFQTINSFVAWKIFPHSVVPKKVSRVCHTRQNFPSSREINSFVLLYEQKRKMGTGSSSIDRKV